MHPTLLAHGLGGAWLQNRASRYAAIVLYDAVAAAFGLYCALWLRFDGGRVPAAYAGVAGTAALLLVTCRTGCNALASIQHWSFRLAGFSESIRIANASLAGSVAFILGLRFVSDVTFPPGVYALELFLTGSLLALMRFGPRFVLQWQDENRQVRSGAEPTLIIGTGPAAEVLARDVRSSPHSHHRLVGFLAEDPVLLGSHIDGAQVVGLTRDLPALVRRHHVTTVLLAEGGAASVRETLEACAGCGVQFKIVPASLRSSKRLSMSMLDDVSPADLLARPAIAFSDGEIDALVRSRCALVTGAAGSIGSELCRQLARHGVRRLIMVDMNENDLYLGARRLASEYPGVDVRAEVADVREPDRLARLGERFRPQDVLHAAAHKHVPLMESAPEEAVKNNIFGTLNVVLMAHHCGAERFVLVSTDKAVQPTSVMGATKRVAELVVRHIGRTSSTSMTAVRFGNVLGSAGSVVPIFKQQIAAGGPVTVTDPNCTRYFMTVSEAVGLILIAGLGRYGDLCVLDMGEPIRIADLARNMITLAGHVPGRDIRIAYTGLRPGEKLYEELLTDEEEHTRVVRNGIYVTTSPPPPRDLPDRLADLSQVAHEGDREAVLAAIAALVPTYGARAAQAPLTSDRPEFGRVPAVVAEAPAIVNGPALSM